MKEIGKHQSGWRIQKVRYHLMTEQCVKANSTRGRSQHDWLHESYSQTQDIFLNYLSTGIRFWKRIVQDTEHTIVGDMIRAKDRLLSTTECAGIWCGIIIRTNEMKKMAICPIWITEWLSNSTWLQKVGSTPAKPGTAGLRAFMNGLSVCA